MSENQVVTVRGLRKRYGDRTVVDGVDLDVGRGEILGLVGANGAGKTTTVECVQGLRRADAGTIRVLGLDPATDGDRVRTLVGSQLQSSGLPDRLRVGEAVRLFGGRDDDRLVERFGLGDGRRTPFAALSGGERQRLFLVLALVNRPRLVILDELTQGLDPKARRDVWEAIGQLRHDGAAVLLVTHDLDEAERLCDRVVAMRAGRVVDAGRPCDLVDRHGRSAMVTFTLPAGAAPEVMAGRLRGVAGVTAASASGGRVTVSGDRESVARVGAALVDSGWIPPDLTVRIPSLDDALVHLLEGADPLPPPVPSQDRQPIGAAR